MLDESEFHPDVLVELAAQGRWADLCERLESLDDEELDAVRHELEGALGSLSEDARELPRRWLHDVMCGREAPSAMSLAQRALVTDGDLAPRPRWDRLDEDEPAIPNGWAKRVAEHPHLRALCVLTVRLLSRYHEVSSTKQDLLNSEFHYLLTERGLSLTKARRSLLQYFCVFTAEDLATLLSARHGFPHLHTLDLDTNMLGDLACDVLASARVLPALRNVHLRKNLLSAAGLERLLVSPFAKGLQFVDARANSLSQQEKRALQDKHGARFAKLRL